MESFSDPLWAEIRKEIGEHCMRSKDYRKANENFQSSLRYEPNKLESVFRLTNSQAREANLDSALQLLNDKSRLGESGRGTNKKLIKRWQFVNSIFTAENYPSHFKCNLQECDVNYEKNQFEQSLLLISKKVRRYQNAIVDIPHSTDVMVKRQNEARKKGPKVLPLMTRFEMVKCLTSASTLEN